MSAAVVYSTGFQADWGSASDANGPLPTDATSGNRQISGQRVLVACWEAARTGPVPVPLTARMIQARAGPAGPFGAAAAGIGSGRLTAGDSVFMTGAVGAAVNDADVVADFASSEGALPDRNITTPSNNKTTTAPPATLKAIGSV